MNEFPHPTPNFQRPGLVFPANLGFSTPTLTLRWSSPCDFYARAYA
jgi:hypothetical protein